MLWQAAANTTYFLRNAGLGLIAFLIYSRLYSGKEPTKRIVRRSFWVAFSRCLIHLLPVTVTISLLWLNLKGHYIGLHLRNNKDVYNDDVALALIQVAAKVQARQPF